MLGVRAHHTPKFRCLFKIFKIQLFSCFITQLGKKLQQWSLNEVIVDILLFVLNEKEPLSDIWLLSYVQNSFGYLKKKKNLIFRQRACIHTWLFVTSDPDERRIFRKDIPENL